MNKINAETIRSEKEATTSINFIFENTRKIVYRPQIKLLVNFLTSNTISSTFRSNTFINKLKQASTKKEEKGRKIEKNGGKQFLGDFKYESKTLHGEIPEVVRD